MHQGPVRIRVRAEPRAGTRGLGGGLSSTGDVTGIVLAGGRSSRFGRDKLAEPYRGAPLLHHAVLALGAACGEIVVVVAPDAPEPELPGALAVRIARDPVEGEGPLVGLAAGLAEVSTDLAVVVAGDMPLIHPAVLEEMLAVAREAAADAVALADGDRFRPLPVVVRVERARETARVLVGRGERRLRALLDALRVAVIDEATWHALDPDRRTLRDVDVPEDLDA